MTILEYAKLVDARDKAQQEYFAFKRQYHSHNSELFEASKELEKQERKATKTILSGENEPSLFGEE